MSAAVAAQIIAANSVTGGNTSTHTSNEAQMQVQMQQMQMQMQQMQQLQQHQNSAMTKAAIMHTQGPPGQALHTQTLQSQGKSGSSTKGPSKHSVSHSSISAERKFFERVKDILLTVSRDQWIEFVKCLELFTDDALSLSDMLDLTADLFGPSNTDLLEEFQRLLDNRADYEANRGDQWFGIPMSEIDFSLCDTCTFT